MQWEQKDLTFLYTWKKKKESVPSNILHYFKYLIYEAQLNYLLEQSSENDGIIIMMKILDHNGDCYNNNNHEA